MLHISDKIKKLPKKDLEKWITDRKKEKRSEDWEKELKKMKDGIARTQSKGKKD